MADFIIIKGLPFQKKEIRYVTWAEYHLPIGNEVDEETNEIPSEIKYNMYIVFTDGSQTNIMFDTKELLQEELDSINETL